MDFGLQGRKGFVGGGGRGIGKAIARELAKEGVDLVIALPAPRNSWSRRRGKSRDETGRRIIPHGAGRNPERPG